MDRKYAAALRSFPPLAKAAEALLQAQDAPLVRVTAQVTAPVLFLYVWHVLEQAERMGLKRLYFLARDGYVMLEIAREIARVCPVSLDLRYLYCSESSLRLPCLHRMDTEEGMALLLQPGNRRTLRHICNRAGLTQEERLTLYTELSVSEADGQKLLSEEAYGKLCDLLRRSVAFRQMAEQHAAKAFAAVRSYLTQEGLTDGTPFGIVDAGWASTVQRSLRRLLDDMPPMTGFYFGLSERPKAADGVCTTWYFAPEDVKRRARFSRSLFSCLCAAPHGAAVGYREENGRFVPVLQENLEDGAMSEAIHKQIALCREFAALCAAEIQYASFPEAEMLRCTGRLLDALMYRPAAWEAEVFRGSPCRDGSLSLLEVQAGSDHWKYGTLAVSRLSWRPLRRWILFWQETAALVKENMQSL